LDPLPTLYCARFVLPIESSCIEDGAVLVSKGRIVAVGTRRHLEAHTPQGRCVDFGEAILLPPCVNAHTHLELTHFPRWAEEAGATQTPDSFVEWIFHLIRVKRRIDPPDFFPSLQAGIVQSLRAGTGAVGDILSHHPGHVAFSTTPLRGRVYLEVLGRDDEVFSAKLKTALALNAQWSAAHLTSGLSPHSPYTLTSAFLEEVYTVAREKGIFVSTHLAESQAEAQFLAEGAGDFAEKLFPAAGWENPLPSRSSPVSYLAERGGLSPTNLLVHAVHVAPDDVPSIARSRASVVLCPRSNAQLGVGKAPIGHYLRAGVALALGTDSLASCDSLSIWDELAFARQWFAGEVSPHDLLRMATLGGAQALGLGGEMGALSPGAGAHFQVLTPRVLPSKANLEEFLCTPGRTAEVTALFLQGRDVLQTL
jgi:aminodeoxyfutalosine deaminase